ncbi:right-handed parallel beta-helix repeat-containing protein [Laspinema olomoucense]|uniref:right-handed parallel beta-helix repeat-containing protein n=1 Tax=Laspinema olomoucense TaxID=3231600 RepID=UPI0021BA7110|nr:right-handed parallel beta-helix repeat-containing protein [Laspinema sp. D3a]MCT7990845.1 right-handed parallel beta-helix repeat-containing protein [Laspinema sp. D3a]
MSRIKRYREFFKRALFNLTIIFMIGVIARNPSQKTSAESWVENDYIGPTPMLKNIFNEQTVSQVIYVDINRSNASNDNPGTEKLPLKNIDKAARIALQNYKNEKSTKIIVFPGVYRESISLTVDKPSQKTLIIFEAKEAGSVILSGSDLWQNWTPLPNANLYVHDWPYNWGVSDNPWPDSIDLEPIVLRREMIFANNNLLRQRTSLSEVSEGDFYVSEEDKKVYIHPSSKIHENIENIKVEVAIRKNLFFARGINNLVVRGFKFHHANSEFFRTPAVAIRNAKNILIENDEFSWNNTVGLQIAQCENVIVKNIKANNNGIAGITGNRLTNVLYEDVESSYNNWRGDWGEFYRWAPGQKFLFLRNATFRRYRAVGNRAAGLWLDFDNAGVRIDESYICNNFHAGLYIEASRHIHVTNTTICNNQANPNSPFHHPGLLGTTSSHVVLENNKICGNDRSQIKIQVVKDTGPREVFNWETEETYLLKSEYWVIRNNLIMANDKEQMLIYLQQDLDDFSKTLVSEGNFWYNPENKRVFQIYKNRPWLSQKNFEEWKILTNQDQDSVFGATDSEFQCGSS